jgi:hypothetical protein
MISLLTHAPGIEFPAARAAVITNPKLSEMIKKAALEGEIVYQGPDPATGLSTQQMIQDMAAVTEKYFGVKLRIKVDNALTFPASTAKTITEIKTGTAPTFDLMYQTDMSGVPLLQEKALEPISWRELFSHITANDLEWNGAAVVNTNYPGAGFQQLDRQKPRDTENMGRRYRSEVARQNQFGDRSRALGHVRSVWSLGRGKDFRLP